MFQIVQVALFLFIKDVIILKTPYVINAELNITPKVNDVSFGKIRMHKPKIVSKIPSIKIKLRNFFSDIINSPSVIRIIY